jgi:2-oxoisovalerate dehydrogenase E1 component
MNKKNYIKKALFIREFEMLLLNLFNRGLLNGTVHTCVGQELIPVVLSDLLLEGDKIFSNHRGHGHYLAFDGDHVSLLAELMGKEDGVSKGIGGSQHIFSNNFISNGIQGGLVPISVGYSYVNKRRKNKSIAITFIGDGTLGQGVLYESLNIASLFNSPNLIILENNKYAQSTYIKDSFAGNLESRILGFGIDYFVTDVWDLEHLAYTLEKAVDNVRNCKPTFVEVNCYRLNSHSKGDDNRHEKEISEYVSKDLLNKFKNDYPDDFSIIFSDINKTLDQALETCLSMHELQEVEKFEHIYNEQVSTSIYNPDFNNQIRINKSIYNGIKNLLSSTETVFIGEDILYKTINTGKPYGGAFKVSGDLSELFPNRVINSPISEQALIGFGIGAALNGFRSIVEIMFGDFMTLGIDQVYQQASKIPSMFGQNIKLPLILRTPMGARRGYGPTHSQNIEKLFMFLPNINLLAINSLVSPEQVYQNISFLDKPTIVIEDKVGYTKLFPAKIPASYNLEHTSEKFPTSILKPNFSNYNVIIFLYGGMLDELIEVLDDLIENEIFPCIICPSIISPLNISPLVNELKNTERIIFIEEGTKYGGLSSEIISYLTEKNMHFKLLGRISNESIIPCAKSAELNAVPNSKSLINEITKLIQNV